VLKFLKDIPVFPLVFYNIKDKKRKLPLNMRKWLCYILLIQVGYLFSQNPGKDKINSFLKCEDSLNVCRKLLCPIKFKPIKQYYYGNDKVKLSNLPFIFYKLNDNELIEHYEKLKKSSDKKVAIIITLGAALAIGGYIIIDDYTFKEMDIQSRRIMGAMIAFSGIPIALTFKIKPMIHRKRMIKRYNSLLLQP
jgi:hypothetical protein